MPRGLQRVTLLSGRGAIVEQGIAWLPTAGAPTNTAGRSTLAVHCDKSTIFIGVFRRWRDSRTLARELHIQGEMCL
jgi:hypothetical protein